MCVPLSVRYNLCMQSLVPFTPVDYLIIGNLAYDLTPSGPRLGGTAAYSALTARALGLRVGVVTSWGEELSLDALAGIQVCKLTARHSTTFENVYSDEGRHQILHHTAQDLRLEDVPQAWRTTPIIHVGPIAGEAKSLANGHFTESMLVLTPQGWLRKRDSSGKVQTIPWPEDLHSLDRAYAAVISLEDIGGDEEQIESLAGVFKILAVTEGRAGARLYWNGDLRRFPALQIEEVDPTGAGDIFAAAFFWRLSKTRDPWTAARFATHLASYSISRPGLEGIPTKMEINSCLVEII
jgi:sugar/nucleoside kinase (ribokinase family)